MLLKSELVQLSVLEEMDRKFRDYGGHIRLPLGNPLASISMMRHNTTDAVGNYNINMHIWRLFFPKAHRTKEGRSKKTLDHLYWTVMTVLPVTGVGAVSSSWRERTRSTSKVICQTRNLIELILVQEQRYSYTVSSLSLCNVYCSSDIQSATSTKPYLCTVCIRSLRRGYVAEHPVRN